MKTNETFWIAGAALALACPAPDSDEAEDAGGSSSTGEASGDGAGSGGTTGGPTSEGGSGGSSEGTGDPDGTDDDDTGDDDPNDGMLKAFPTAEGFGAQAVGGRGGQIIEVTTLADAGSGSLRACIDAEGPRTCVFRVAGTIELDSVIDIRNPFLTIAGQTAPGGGITIKSVEPITVGCNCEIGEGDPGTNDIIIRHVRFRRDVRPDTQPIDDNEDALNMFGGSYNVIVDHCSFSWGTDETMSVTGKAHEVTVQWSIVSESYFKGSHVTGGSYNVSLHHNLFAHNQERNPKMRGRPEHLDGNMPIYDFVNNVVYNWTNYATAVAGNGMGNVVANFYKLGPNTNSYPYPREIVRMQDTSVPGAERSIYAVGNMGPTCPQGCSNDWDDGMVSDIGGGLGNISRSDRRHPAPEVETSAADQAYADVIADAGATMGLDELGQPFIRRDAVDVRIMDEVESGGGGNIGMTALPQSAWPVLDPGTAYPDADHDGMADPWETEHGFDPSDPGDGNGDRDGDGYTNVEEFLNVTDPG